MLAAGKLALEGDAKAAWGAELANVLSAESVAKVIGANGEPAVEEVALFIAGMHGDGETLIKQGKPTTEWLIKALAIEPHKPKVSKLIRQLLAVDQYTGNLDFMQQWDPLVKGAEALLTWIGEFSLLPLFNQETLGQQLSDSVLRPYIRYSLHAGIQAKPSQSYAVPAVVAFLEALYDYKNYGAVPERMSLLPFLILAQLLQQRFKSAITRLFVSSSWCDVSVADVKGASRCIVKMYADYYALPSPKGQWLLDLLRCLLVVPNVPGLYSSIEAVGERFGGYVQLKNPFSLPEGKRAERNHLLLLNGTIVYTSGVSIGELVNGTAADAVQAELMAGWKVSGEPMARWRNMVDSGFEVLRNEKLASEPASLCAEVQFTLGAVAESRHEMHGPYDIGRAGNASRLAANFKGVGGGGEMWYTGLPVPPGMHPQVGALSQAFGESDMSFLFANMPDFNLGGEKEAISLWDACFRGQAEIIKPFLAKGASYVNDVGYGSTGLYVAAEQNHPDVVGVMLQAGADVTDVDKATITLGMTPLIVASQKGFVEIVEMLLDAGASVNKAANNGVTPLYIASLDGHLNVVKHLLEAGADTSLAWNGKTPLMIAENKGFTEIIALLQ